MLNWAGWVLIGLCVLDLGCSIGKHGQQKDKHNGWVSLMSFAITMPLILKALNVF